MIHSKLIIRNLLTTLLFFSFACCVSSKAITHRNNIEKNCLSQPTNISLNTRAHFWNHIQPNAIYKNLSHPVNDYYFQHTTSHDKCPLISLILVKKLGDWTQSHVTGIELTSGEKVKFSDISAVSFELWIDGKNSVLPSYTQIAKHYSFLSEQQVKQLDKANYDLLLTLFSERDAEGYSYNASFHLTINPEQANQWLTIKLPFKQMQWYKEKQYEEQMINQQSMANFNIKGLRLVAETQSERVARHFAKAYVQQHPITTELFKEVAIKLKQINLLPLQ